MEVKTLSRSALFIQVLSYYPLPCNNTTPKRAFEKLIYSYFLHFCWLLELSKVAPTRGFSWNYSLMPTGGCSHLTGLPAKIVKGTMDQAPIRGLYKSFGFHTTWVLRSVREHPKVSIPRDPGTHWKRSYYPTSEVIQSASAKAVNRQAHPDLRGWRNGSPF